MLNILPRNIPRFAPLLMAAASAVAFGLTSPQLNAGPIVMSPAPRPAVPMEALDWFDHSVNPVTDPILFEDAIIRNEIRPVFGYQNIGHDCDCGFPGGHLEVYGIQLRYAATSRLGFMLTKGGYNDIHLGDGRHLTGFGNLAFGAKYALIDDKANQFILTPGFTFEIPTGKNEVFQGRGNGIWNLFFAAEKGFGDFHLLANAGFIIPNSRSANSSEFHYHLQADYYVCKWFKPFVALNGYSVISAGKSVPLSTEGYDLVNFGSSESGGSTQLTLGGGFRSELAKGVDIGVSYEKSVHEPHGLLDDRFTVDLSFHF